jgi:predicted regulator of Ras-like GTPase activity (Roadblock/LC7/MglB family)
VSGTDADDLDPEAPVHLVVRAQLDVLRRQVRAIRGSLVATSDGLLVAADLPDGEAEQVAALTSTLVGLAGYAIEVTRTGVLIEAVARGTGGYVAAYALGDAAALAVVGEADLNVAMLHHKTKPVVEHLTTLSGRFVGFVDAAGASTNGATPGRLRPADR